MATNDPEVVALESAQEHIPMCEKHDLKIDMICEDCEEFICKQCAKTDHKNHDWNTISTAGTLRRRELKKTLGKIKEENLNELDVKIITATRQMEDNQKCCDSEVSQLQNQFDTIVLELKDIKKSYKKRLKDILEKKNAEVSEKKSHLKKKRKKINSLVNFLEDKHSTMSDYSLIDNLRDLTILVSNRDCDIESGNYSGIYRREDISEGSLDSIMGQMLDLDDFTATETNSFKHSSGISILEAIDEDTCFVGDLISNFIEKVNIRNKKKTTIKTNVNGVCVTDNGDVYFTDFKNKSLVRLFTSGSVSTIFSTSPLAPKGICQSTEGGLLVTLSDRESEPFQLDSHSRRLVSHVTLTGDVIREYEYQEDGQTRLFTVPARVKQNGNTDICVVNLKSDTSGELVILSSSGGLRFVYKGKNKGFKFDPTDVVCDSYCNIIVTDCINNHVHLLSPDGEFLKYLLTEKEVTNPIMISLYKSTLWEGNASGLVKVFQYYN